MTEYDDLDDILATLKDATEDEPSKRATTKAAREAFTKELKSKAATFITTTETSLTTFLDATGIKSAAAAIRRLPVAGETIHGVTFEDFTVFDIIPTIYKLSGFPKIDRLVFTTLGFGFNNLQTLDNLINARKLDPANLYILASGFFRTMEKGMWQTAEQHATSYGYTLRTCRNHTKIILLKIGENHYVVESSSNMRSCKAIEQFTLLNSKPLYDFQLEWILRAHIFASEQPKKPCTVNKPLIL